MAVLTQSAQRLDLSWTANDPVSLAFTVAGANWSGTYTAQIRQGATRDTVLLATMTVVATFSTPDTLFTLTLADSTTVPLTGGYWDLQQASGVTRLSGRVIVTPDVSV